jgi:hypothetical protein
MRDSCQVASFLAPLVLLGACFVPSIARADEPVDEQRVNTLFAEAREAFVAGDFATACPKYEEVVRIKPGLGARIGLGDCYRAQGRLAKAWETYQAVVDEVPEIVKRAKGFKEQSTAQKRGDEARARIQEIEPKLGWIVVVVPEALAAQPNLTVRIDAMVLAREKYGVRFPLDRGEHVINVGAPGKKSWEKSVAMGEGAELLVPLQPLEDDVPPVKTDPVVKPPPDKIIPAIGPVSGDKPPPDTKIGQKNDFFGPQRIAGLSLGVVGLGAVVAGSVFGLRAIEKRDASEVDGHCIANSCDEIGLPLRQASYDAGNASTGLFIGGGVALAAGVALFLTAPKRPASVQAAFVVGPSSLHCIGRF